MPPEGSADDVLGQGVLMSLMSLLQADVFVFKHLDQTATQWCFYDSLSSFFDLKPAECSDVCLSVHPSVPLMDVAAVRLNVLCTDVNVGSVRWTGSPWRNVPVKHAVHACCPGNGESPGLDQNYQLLSHQLPDGRTRPRVGFKCTQISLFFSYCDDNCKPPECTCLWRGWRCGERKASPRQWRWSCIAVLWFYCSSSFLCSGVVH